jgi:HK97 family phage major capsid protein
MSAATVLSLRKQRRELSERMSACLNSTSPSALAEWRALDAQQDKLGQEIQRIEQDILERAESVANGNHRFERPNVGEHNDRALSRTASASYKRDFEVWIRTGKESAEMRALGDASGAPGAQLVPQGFSGELEAKMKYWNGVANIARTITTDTGNPLPWPTMDDTSNTGEWLAEAAPVTTADPTFGNVTLGANLLSSKQVKVSVALAQDSAFDMGALLLDAFGERLGRAQDTAYWTGDGSTIPVTGLLTALQAAGGRSVLAVGANLNDGVSTALNSVGSDDFSNLIDKLDRGYQRPTNHFVFSQTTGNALRKLKDKYGRPVWEVSLAQGSPETIFGYPFQIDNAFANIGAGNVSVAFGDFSKYVIRRALGITLVRFNELYMPNYQIAFQAFLRTDAKLLQSAAFSILTHPLS